MFPAVVVLSGPEKTRAKAELALEKARLTIIPPNEWPIQRQSYAAEHWPPLTPWPMVRLPDKDEYVPAPHVDTKVEHGFVAVLAETEELFHAAYACVEKHKWVLRVHHELPERPQPREDPMAMLLQRMDAQEQRIAELTRKLGGYPSVGGAGFEAGAGEFMQAGTYSAAQMRRTGLSWAARATTTVGSAVANTPGAITGGLISAVDMQLSNAGSGLVVNTSTGECLIPGQEASNQGGYHAFLSSQNSTTLATANGSNPRIDLICATSADSGYTIPSGGTSGYVTIQAVTGTPTSGATLSNLSGAPALPLSSLLLGYALVPAAAINLTSGDIANKATVVQAQPYIPGAQLGKTIYAPSNTTYNLNTSTMTAIDGTHLAVTFTAPTSGAVTVKLSGQYLAASTVYINVGVLSGGSVVGNVPMVLNGYNAGVELIQYITTDIEVTSLTAGSSYTFQWAAIGYVGGNLLVGNYAGTGTSGTNYPPATMKIFAA